MGPVRHPMTTRTKYVSSNLWAEMKILRGGSSVPDGQNVSVPDLQQQNSYNIDEQQWNPSHPNYSQMDSQFIPPITTTTTNEVMEPQQYNNNLPIYEDRETVDERIAAWRQQQL